MSSTIGDIDLARHGGGNTHGGMMASSGILPLTTVWINTQRCLLIHYPFSYLFRFGFVDGHGTHSRDRSGNDNHGVHSNGNRVGKGRNYCVVDDSFDIFYG